MRGENHRARFTSRRFESERRTGKNRQPWNEADRKDLLQDFADAQVGGRLQALGGAHDDGFGRNVRKRLRENFASMCGRNDANDDMGAAERFAKVHGWYDASRDGDAGKIGLVLAIRFDGLRNRGFAYPQRDVVAASAVGQDNRKPRAPAASAKNRDLRHSDMSSDLLKAKRGSVPSRRR